MTGKSIALVVMAVTLSAAGALAADPPVEPDKQRLVCRGATKSLGSHIRRPRRCRTAEKWRQEDEEKGRIPLGLQTTEGQNDGRQGPTPQ